MFSYHEKKQTKLPPPQALQRPPAGPCRTCASWLPAAAAAVAAGPAGADPSLTSLPISSHPISSQQALCPVICLCQTMRKLDV